VNILGGMFTMRPKGSSEVLLARRKQAIKLLLTKKFSLNEVARRIGCSVSSVMRWRDMWNKGGEEGLKVRIASGRPPKLNKKQKAELLRMLMQGPMAFGWNTDVWTTKRVVELIRRKFSVTYHFSQVSRILHAQGWSAQKPERRALERNEAAIREWKTTTWKRVKKTPRG